ASSNWFACRALIYMRQNPWPMLKGMARKLESGFSWRLNPYREPLAQAAYSTAYVPIVILGFVGVLLARRRREIILIGLLFLLFRGVSMVFWANTSHRSYLDVYLIVCAAWVMERLWLRFEPSSRLRFAKWLIGNGGTARPSLLSRATSSPST